MLLVWFVELVVVEEGTTLLPQLVQNLVEDLRSVWQEVQLKLELEIEGSGWVTVVVLAPSLSFAATICSLEAPHEVQKRVLISFVVQFWHPVLVASPTGPGGGACLGSVGVGIFPKIEEKKPICTELSSELMHGFWRSSCALTTKVCDRCVCLLYVSVAHMRTHVHT